MSRLEHEMSEAIIRIAGLSEGLKICGESFKILATMVENNVSREELLDYLSSRTALVAEVLFVAYGKLDLPDDSTKH